MTQASAEKSMAYRLAIGASVVLSGSWLSYLAYLGGATITKQSVYMGEITFYAALLLAVTGIALGVLIGSVGYLARTRHRLAKTAAFWAAGAMLVVVAVFFVTRPIISNAS